MFQRTRLAIERAPEKAVRLRRWRCAPFVPITGFGELFPRLRKADAGFKAKTALGVFSPMDPPLAGSMAGFGLVTAADAGLACRRVNAGRRDWPGWTAGRDAAARAP
jgi:hypothetical protein